MACRALRLGALGNEQTAGQPDTWQEVHGGHGAGASMEADVLVLLPVPAGHCTLHAEVLGVNCVQVDARFCCGDGLYTGHFMTQHIMAILHYFVIVQ